MGQSVRRDHAQPRARSLHQRPVGPRRERAQVALPQDKKDIRERRRVTIEQGLRRQQRVAAIMPLAHKYEEAAGGRESADLLKVLQDRRCDRVAGL